MRRAILLVSFLFALAAWASGPASAQTAPRTGWVLLGTVKVDGDASNESVALADDAPAVTAIRLEARSGAIRLARVNVAWGDGQMHSEERVIDLLQGERTRPIDLRPLPRKPLNVALVRTPADGRRPTTAQVEIWGLTAPAATTAASRSRGDRMLAADVRLRETAGRGPAGARGGGTQVVLAEAGRLGRIRVHVRGADISSPSVVLKYDSGESQTLTVDGLTRRDTSTAWLPVDASRRLTSLEIAPLAIAPAQGEAMIDVYGERPPEIVRSVKRASKRSARPSVDLGTHARPQPRITDLDDDASRPRSAALPPDVTSRDAGGGGGGAPATRGPSEPIGGSAPPPVPAAAPPKAASAPVAAPTCIAETRCTPVPVFFGTNRGRNSATAEIAFTSERTEKLTLGQATVTVPRAFRKKGEITLPSWWDLLSLRNPWTHDPARHFTILAGATRVYATSEQFLAEVARSMAAGGDFKDHAFIYVHGFNVPFEYALYRAAQISYDLGHEDHAFGTAFVFSWPSAGDVNGYAYDTDSSRFAVRHLKSFIELVALRSGAKHVHLVAHSMGNATLMPALEELAENAEIRARLGQVILAAPDVDAKEFGRIAERILPMAKSLTLYASSSDLAMVASRKAHSNAPRAGDLIDGRPVLIKDMDSIDVSAVSTAIFDLKHNVYADKKELLNDIRRLMLTGLRPPHVRDINLRRISDSTGTFWKYVE